MRNILSLTVIFLTLVGCGSTPVKYDNRDSYALNVVRAAGISGKLKDTELPKDTVKSLTDSPGFGLTYAVSGYGSPLPGLSSGQTAGLNLVSWLFAPTAPAARNSLIAWMPESFTTTTPEEALADLLLEATSQAVTDLGFIPVTEIGGGGTDKSGVGVYVTNRNDKSCLDNEHGKSNCWVSFGIRQATLTDKPPEHLGSTGRVWFFDPGANSYSRFIFPKNNTGFNELELLLAISKRLPEWVYFYVAPKKVYLDSDKPVKAPLVINQGRVHYFVKAKMD